MNFICELLLLGFIQQMMSSVRRLTKKAKKEQTLSGNSRSDATKNASKESFEKSAKSWWN